MRKKTVIKTSPIMMVGEASYRTIDLNVRCVSEVMMIAPNSCAHKGKKERREVKGEYGGV